MVSNKKNWANTKVIQNFLLVKENEKNDLLLQLLQDELTVAKEHARMFNILAADEGRREGGGVIGLMGNTQRGWH